METVWRARVLGADGATKAVGKSNVVGRESTDMSQEVETRMSRADGYQYCAWRDM